LKDGTPAFENDVHKFSKWAAYFLFWGYFNI